ncbi:MAG: MotA/TolQ/ExbB proton channel family protein, partial [Candidatus Methylomirabilales bacterium]
MSGISLLHLVLEAGPVAKAVLVILLLFSVGSWAVIFMKLRSLRRAERQSDDFLRQFRSSKNLSSMYDEAKRYPLSPVASLFREGYRELTYHMKGNPHPRANPEGATLALSSDERAKVQEGLGRTLRHGSLKELSQLERHLIFLATTGSVTPFIGLFGTVWGIINAFVGIG